MLSVWSREVVTFDDLIKRIYAGMTPMVCQDCGYVVSGEEQCDATDTPGERLCPSCCSKEMVEATTDMLNEAFDFHYPWTRCEHCGYYLLFDESIGKELESPDDHEPGTWGCPNCRKMTY